MLFIEDQQRTLADSHAATESRVLDVPWSTRQWSSRPTPLAAARGTKESRSPRYVGSTFWVSHLVRTQKVGLRRRPHKATVLKAVQDTKRSSACDCSRFCSCEILQVQHASTAGGNHGLKTKDLPRGFQVENLVPNQILRLVEIY